MRGNPVSKYIDWRLQCVSSPEYVSSPICAHRNQYDEEGSQLPRDQWQLDEQDEIGEKLYQAWREGRTGYPWIDAIMRQLRLEGWIHHLARHGALSPSLR